MNMGQTVLKGGMNVPTCTWHGQSAVVHTVLLQLTASFLWNYNLAVYNEKSLQHCHSFQQPAGIAWGAVGAHLPGHAEPLCSQALRCLGELSAAPGQPHCSRAVGCLPRRSTVSCSHFGGHSFQLILAQLSVRCAYHLPPCPHPKLVQSSLLQNRKGMR